LTSLSQWFPLFKDIILFKPQLYVSKPPSGWSVISNNVPIVSLCSTRSGMLQRRLSTRLAAEKSLHGIDLLYARMPNYEGFWVYQVAKKMGIPLLLELHGDWVSSIQEEDQQNLLRRITRWGRAIHADRAVIDMAAYAKAIVTIGAVLKKKYAPLCKPTLVCTNHLLSVTEYWRRSDFQLKNPPLILFVGDIQRRKGLHYLFEALRELKVRGYPFQMVLVGDGPQMGELKVYARQAGFLDQVIFVGRISHGPDLFTWFRKADLFILPSIAAEGVPRVTHEAMAMGCPVIATDIGSVAWQLRDGAGIVIPAGKPTQLTNAICEVLDSEDLRSDLSKKGYSRSLDHTIEQQQSQIADFVKALFC
jgi:glycosyltransferase involved in cell wall biosynthesis